MVKNYKKKNIKYYKTIKRFIGSDQPHSHPTKIKLELGLTSVAYHLHRVAVTIDDSLVK